MPPRLPLEPAAGSRAPGQQRGCRSGSHPGDMAGLALPCAAGGLAPGAAEEARAGLAAGARAQLCSSAHPGKPNECGSAQAAAVVGNALPHTTPLCCAAFTCTLQAAWRGWRVRRLLAAARLSLQQQLAEVGSSLDLELSCGSLDGLLGGGGFTGLATFDAPEALRPELAAAAGGLPCSSAAVAPAPPSRWADSGRGTPAAPPDSRQQQEQQLPPAPAAPSAAAPAARPPAAGEAGWEFEVPATAAAFQQMRQRQLAVARRRQLEQQRRDPVARLQEFQCRTGLGRSGSSRGSAASSSNGSSSASACGLAAPRSPRAAGARASPPQQAGSPKGDRRSGSGRAPVRVRVLQLDG